MPFADGPFALRRYLPANLRLVRPGMSVWLHHERGRVRSQHLQADDRFLRTLSPPTPQIPGLARPADAGRQKLTARLFGALNYVWMTVVIPMIRPVMIGHAILVVVASALWIASIHVHEPSRQALIWLAIAFGGWSIPATFQACPGVDDLTD